MYKVGSSDEFKSKLSNSKDLKYNTHFIVYHTHDYMFGA